MSDYARVKKELHPLFVMQHMGCVPAEVGVGKVTYHSPFRPDATPSFDVYYNEDQGCWKYGDWAEGSGGDVIDLLERFGKTIADAWVLITQQSASGWAPPPVPEPKPFDGSAYENATDSLADAIGEHWDHNTPSQGQIDDTPAWLDGTTSDWYNDVWRLRASGTTLLIPYWDADDEFIAYKTRPIDGPKLNAPGSKLCLYGLWRLEDDERTIIVCEGESDTWSAQWSLGNDWIALGLPGVHHRPEAVGAERLAGRSVVIAFDGDEAGRSGTQVWVSYLTAAGCDVSVAPVPEGKDLSDLSPAAIVEVVARRRYPSPAPTGIVRLGAQYHLVNRDGSVGKELGNWALDVQRVLHGDGGELAFEGLLLPTRAQVVLPAVAMSSSNKLANWAIAHGVAWSGGGQDHSKLLQLLQHETFATPTGRMTNKVGFHEGDWVWPGGHYGVHDWTYVPPVADVGLDQSMKLTDHGQWDKHGLVRRMIEFYAPEISTPILAWLAASFVRPLFKQFPVLYISGTSGCGKTTLIEHMLPMVTGSLIETNLTNTTPHAMAGFFGCSTSFPIWFDEYRPGMRLETKQMFDQMLRDSYNGKRSSKGGQDRSNLSAISSFDTAVPVVVSGEDSMVETSIIDRTILVRLTKDRQGTLGWSDQNLGHAIIKMLSHEAGAILRGGFIRVVPEGPKDLNDRQRYNLGVLRQGWGIIQDLCGPHFDIELDLSHVIEQGEAGSLSSPLEDALDWAIDQGHHYVWIDDDDIVHLQADEFLKDVKRADIFTLPVTNVQGVKSFFIDKHNAENVRVRHEGTQKRVLRFPRVLN